MKKLFRRSLALVLALVSVLGLLTACGGGEEQQAGEQTATKKYINVSTTAPQTTCNPYTSQAATDNTVVGYVTDCLYGIIPDEVTKKGARVPIYATAEPVDVNGDGTVWQMDVRPDAKWMNGEPITAATFMYSWKTCLDPNCVFVAAGSLSNNMVKIKNAKEYYTQNTTGVPVAWEDVGLKQLDDDTLEVTLDGPYTKAEVMAHFSQQFTAPIYEPLFEAGMNSDHTETTYGTEKTQTMSCGPFYISEWIKGSEIRYEKNPNWPFADRIVVDGIVNRVVQDNNTQIQMFEGGELDYVGIGVDGLEKYEEDPRLNFSTSNWTNMIDICSTNTEEPILANKNFKEALSYAIDRETIARLTKNLPATWLISEMAVAYTDGTFYRDLPFTQDYIKTEEDNWGYDPVKAKQLFDKAMEEEGLDKVEISFLYNSDGAGARTTAQFLQEALANIFGPDKFSLVLDGMPNALMLDIKKNTDKDPNAYELTFSRWSMASAKYQPIRSLEVYTTEYKRKNAPYRNEEANELFKLAMSPEVRMDEVKFAETTAAMERSLITNYDTIPIMEETSYTMFSDSFVRYLPAQDPTLGWGIIYSDVIR